MMAETLTIKKRSLFDSRCSSEVAYRTAYSAASESSAPQGELFWEKEISYTKGRSCDGRDGVYYFSPQEFRIQKADKPYPEKQRSEWTLVIKVPTAGFSTFQMSKETIFDASTKAHNP